jgi:hypothetical protein
MRQHKADVERAMANNVHKSEPQVFLKKCIVSIHLKETHLYTDCKVDMSIVKK